MKTTVTIVAAAIGLTALTAYSAPQNYWNLGQQSEQPHIEISQVSSSVTQPAMMPPTGGLSTYWSGSVIQGKQQFPIRFY